MRHIFLSAFWSQIVDARAHLVDIAQNSGVWSMMMRTLSIVTIHPKHPNSFVSHHGATIILSACFLPQWTRSDDPRARRLESGHSLTPIQNRTACEWCRIERKRAAKHHSWCFHQLLDLLDILQCTQTAVVVVAVAAIEHFPNSFVQIPWQTGECESEAAAEFHRSSEETLKKHTKIKRNSWIFPSAYIQLRVLAHSPGKCARS